MMKDSLPKPRGVPRPNILRKEKVKRAWYDPRKYTDAIRRESAEVWRLFAEDMRLIPSTCAFVTREVFNRQSRRSYSKYVSKVKESAPDIRRELRITELAAMVQPHGHSHPMSAMQRSAASVTFSNIIREAGYEPYSVSMSVADQLKNQRGFRLVYTDKDLKMKLQDDVVRSTDVLTLVDVDYHADMPSYLRYFRPIMMYTLQPTQAAYRTHDYSYYVSDNKVHYNVSGGAEYEHEIWDYDHDVISASYRGYTNFFEVDQRDVTVNADGGGHRIITLVPFARLPNDLASSIKSTPLKRKEYTINGVSTVYNASTGNVSISIDGSNESVELPARVFHGLIERLRGKTGAFTVGDVEVFIHDQVADRKVGSAFLYGALMRRGLDCKLNTNHVATASVISSYRPLGSRPFADAVVPCQVLTTPIVTNPALFPEKCADSSTAAVKMRVTDAINKKVPPPIYGTYAAEFVVALVPEHMAGTGLPVSLDEVIEAQTRPMQKARTERVKHNLGVGAHNRLESFVKAEAYAKVTGPRIITTCRAELTVEMMRFVMAFKRDLLVNLDWYGPCKTPLEAITRFREFGQHGFLLDDFSMYDGSITKWLKDNVPLAAYQRWVNIQDRSLLKDYVAQVYKDQAMTSDGDRYDPGPGTRSGSPVTTDFNTTINGYVHYCAYRKLGFGPAEAYGMLGLYAGDDGLTPNLPGLEQALREVCVDLGLNIKLSAALPGERITYLGRVFPHPMTHVDSHQEAVRTLAKIHLSANKTVSRNQAAFNKATGYLSSDAMTPVISDWAKRCYELSGITTARGMLGDEQWKVENGAWPQVDADVIAQSFAKDLGLSSQELADYASAVRVADNFDSFPAHYNNGPKEVVIPAIVGDVLLTPKPVEQCPKISPPPLKKQPTVPLIQQRREPMAKMVQNGKSKSSPAVIVTPLKSESPSVVAINSCVLPLPISTSSPPSMNEIPLTVSPNIQVTTKPPVNLLKASDDSSLEQVRTKRQRRKRARTLKRREQSERLSSMDSTKPPMSQVELTASDFENGTSSQVKNLNEAILVLAEVH